MLPLHSHLEAFTEEAMTVLCSTATSWPARLARCTDLAVATGGPISHFRRKLTFNHRASALLGDALWEFDAVPPLQLIARRGIRRLYARSWVVKDPRSSFDEYIQRSIVHLHIPAFLAQYIAQPLPSTYYAPGTQEAPRFRGFAHEYQRLHGLCVHYLPWATCDFGQCSSGVRPYWVS
jgi:hypothetical protein